MESVFQRPQNGYSVRIQSEKFDAIVIGSEQSGPFLAVPTAAAGQRMAIRSGIRSDFLALWQRAIFANHACVGTVLMFNPVPQHGESLGEYRAALSREPVVPRI